MCEQLGAPCTQTHSKQRQIQIWNYFWAHNFIVTPPRNYIWFSSTTCIFVYASQTWVRRRRYIGNDLTICLPSSANSLISRTEMVMKRSSHPPRTYWVMSEHIRRDWLNSHVMRLFGVSSGVSFDITVRRVIRWARMSQSHSVWWFWSRRYSNVWADRVYYNH